MWALAQRYFNGSILSSPLAMTIRPTAPDGYSLLCDTLRGTYFKLQSTSDLNVPFTDEPGGFVLALDGLSTLTVPGAVPQKYFRVVHSLAP